MQLSFSPSSSSSLSVVKSAFSLKNVSHYEFRKRFVLGSVCSYRPVFQYGSMDTKSRLGLRLKAIRKEKKLTQDELAARIGRSVDALSNLERGKSLPSFHTIELLCRALNIPLKSLFDFEEASLPHRKAQLLEELLSLARKMPEADLELAVEQIRVLGRRKPRM